MSLEVTALSSKRFKATIAQSGPRVLLRIPFNPNEAWGVKQHHYVSGSINGCKIRGRLESAGTEYFFRWARRGAVTMGLTPGRVSRSRWLQTVHNPIA